MKLKRFYRNIMNIFKRLLWWRLSYTDDETGQESELGEVIGTPDMSENDKIAERILKESIDSVHVLKTSFPDIIKNKLVATIVEKISDIHDIYAKEFANDTHALRKLQQFHYYYTNHFVKVLTQLAKKKEKENAVYTNDIKKINNNIKTLSNNNNTSFNVNDDMYKHVIYEIIFGLVLTVDGNNYVTKHTVPQLNRVLKLYANIIPYALFDKLKLPNEFTETGSICISNELISDIKQHHYDIKYVNLYRYDDNIVILFNILNTDVHFVFSALTNSYIKIDTDTFNEFKLYKDTLFKQNIKQLNKNKLLLAKLIAEHKPYELDENTMKTLTNLLKKINKDDVFNICNNDSDLNNVVNELNAVIDTKKIDI
jgi:hypothetical protein